LNYFMTRGDGENVGASRPRNKKINGPVRWWFEARSVNWSGGGAGRVAGGKSWLKGALGGPGGMGQSCHSSTEGPKKFVVPIKGRRNAPPSEDVT